MKLDLFNSSRYEFKPRKRHHHSGLPTVHSICQISGIQPCFVGLGAHTGDFEGNRQFISVCVDGAVLPSQTSSPDVHG